MTWLIRIAVSSGYFEMAFDPGDFHSAFLEKVYTAQAAKPSIPKDLVATKMYGH